MNQGLSRYYNNFFVKSLFINFYNSILIIEIYHSQRMQCNPCLVLYSEYFTFI